MTVVSNLAILYNIGAISGALVIGSFSDRLGRRYSLMLALVISSLSIPLWAFGSSMIMLAIGSFMMQFGVQGAFGVIPAHLNELSPASVRSLFPGVVYQLGHALRGAVGGGGVRLAQAPRLSMGAYRFSSRCCVIFQSEAA
jgi:SHS family lactate transporter-like MFS transporter